MTIFMLTNISHSYPGDEFARGEPFDGETCTWQINVGSKPTKSLMFTLINRKINCQKLLKIKQQDINRYSDGFAFALWFRWLNCVSQQRPPHRKCFRRQISLIFWCLENRNNIPKNLWPKYLCSRQHNMLLYAMRFGGAVIKRLLIVASMILDEKEHDTLDITRLVFFVSWANGYFNDAMSLASNKNHITLLFNMFNTCVSCS